MVKSVVVVVAIVVVVVVVNANVANALSRMKMLPLLQWLQQSPPLLDHQQEWQVLQRLCQLRI
jgi:hypothetical protein